jgi:O-antigen ligase
MLYPVRYWLFVIYAVGVPGFLKFDPTGRVHEFGLFNPQSIASIVLTCCTALFFFCIATASRKAIIATPTAIDLKPFVALLAVLSIATLLSPKDDFAISFYRLGEWFLGFCLLLSTYTRQPREQRDSFAVSLMAQICWIDICIVWIFLLFYPSLAVNSPEELTGAIQIRLGGYVIHPNTLGVLAGIAFWHALLFLRGGRKLLALVFTLSTLVLTYSRGAWLGFAATVVLYILFSKKSAVRVLGILATMLASVGAILFSDKMIDFLGRGQGEKSLATLSQRTEVWALAAKMISQRPLLGYGYIDGVKVRLASISHLGNFFPPHVHNEFLQAWASGGILAALLIFLVYWRGLRQAFRLARGSVYRLFILFTLVQLFFYSLAGPIITKSFVQVGALLLICFLTSADGYWRMAGSQPPSRASIDANHRADQVTI